MSKAGACRTEPIARMEAVSAMPWPKAKLTGEEGRHRPASTMCIGL